MNKADKSEIKGLDRLTPERQQLVCMVLDNLNSGLGLWHRNWTQNSAPVSGVTGRAYRGVNNMFLSLVAIERGYKDNRWVTYNQMMQNGWRFKRGAGGDTVAKGKSVLIEFFEFRDRDTKAPFDISKLNGLTAREKEAYMQEHIYPVRKAYRVFNADIVEGMPPKVNKFEKSGRNDRVEELLKYWNENESKIMYGGDDAYYIKSRDEIHLPPRESFATYTGFYATSLHELSHSTAHSSRLDRDFYGYGSREYSVEELRAEISSLFLCQEYGVRLTDKVCKNESAYIRNWVQSIKDNPEYLFRAIADADKISRYVLAKEQDFILAKNLEGMDFTPGEIPDAVAETARDEERAEIQAREQKAAEEKKAADASAAAAAAAAAAGPAAGAPGAGGTGTAGGTDANATEEEGKGSRKGHLMPPSEAVSEERLNLNKPADPLVALSDISVYERAAHTRSGQRFLALYNGRDIMRNIDKSRQTLFSRLAVFTQDEDQLCRIMASSGLFDKTLPDSYYRSMARTALSDMARMRKEGVHSSMNPTDRMPRDGEEKAG